VTQRRCEACGRQWITFGAHDPCPDCGHVQRLELGMDRPPEPTPGSVREDIRWDAVQENLPIA
jgi:hypothetical protein